MTLCLYCGLVTSVWIEIDDLNLALLSARFFGSGNTPSLFEHQQGIGGDDEAGVAPPRVVEKDAAGVLTGDDLKAFNTFESPNKVTPHAMTKPTTASGKTKFEVPAKSYTVIQWGA